MKGASMVSIRLAYIVEDKDRHGNVRIYVRVPGCPKVRIRETPGTAEFVAAYQAAIAQAPAKPGLPDASTFRGVCARYYASPVFDALDPSTRKWRRRYLDRICEKGGDRPIAMLQPRQVRRMYQELHATPGAARMLLKALKALFRWAIDEDLVTFDPTRAVRVNQHATDGHHTWTLDEVEQFEERHPLGSKARLAMALMLYTGGRREDAVRLGPPHIRKGRVRFTQAKNEHRKPVKVDIPLYPNLAAAIDAHRSGHMTFLVTSFGKPFTTAGFGNWFRERCDEAGLPQCSAHGLRKAIASRLAEAGASGAELMAVTGHQSLEEVDTYIREARRSKMADGGFKKLREA